MPWCGNQSTGCSTPSMSSCGVPGCTPRARGCRDRRRWSPYSCCHTTSFRVAAQSGDHHPRRANRRSRRCGTAGRPRAPKPPHTSSRHPRARRRFRHPQPSACRRRPNPRWRGHEPGDIKEFEDLESARPEVVFESPDAEPAAVPFAWLPAAGRAVRRSGVRRPGRQAGLVVTTDETVSTAAGSPTTSVTRVEPPATVPAGGASGTHRRRDFLDLEDSVSPLAKVDARRQHRRGADRGRRLGPEDPGGAGQRLDHAVDLRRRHRRGGGCRHRPRRGDAAQGATAFQVHALDLLLTQLEKTLGLEVGRIGIEGQIENAKGLVEVAAIAGASPGSRRSSRPGRLMASIN